jgi:hypothetical protein
MISTVLSMCVFSSQPYEPAKTDRPQQIQYQSQATAGHTRLVIPGVPTIGTKKNGRGTNL